MPIRQTSTERAAVNATVATRVTRYAPASSSVDKNYVAIMARNRGRTDVQLIFMVLLRKSKLHPSARSRVCKGYVKLKKERIAHGDETVSSKIIVQSEISGTIFFRNSVSILYKIKYKNRSVSKSVE